MQKNYILWLISDIDRKKYIYYNKDGEFKAEG